MQISLVFPHQLFRQNPALQKGQAVWLIEEELFFKQYTFHRQKLILHRASMQFYKDYLQKQGFDCYYVEAPAGKSLESLCAEWKADGIEALQLCDPSDYLLKRRLTRYAKKEGLRLQWEENPNFVSPLNWLKSTLENTKNYRMHSFYIEQRKRLQVLVTEEGKPLGGKWSFDAENRKKLPKDIVLPELYRPERNVYVVEAQDYATEHFPDAWGKAENFAYACTFEEAEQALADFLEKRMFRFGDYEDAIAPNAHYLFHSVLTPYLNTGLLQAQEVLDAVLSAHKEKDYPLNSLEGFVRQIIGWREYMRGIYELEGSFERTHNHFGFTRKIPRSFWEGTTGIEPIDNCIQKVSETAYLHHIERLMILGNFMLLCEFDPDEVYRWFMEVFIDAYDWVMVPNVYGMSQYSDGGLITTKPYVSGSNYIRKMSPYKKGEWAEIWDGLYWRYIHEYQSHFKGNPRMSMMLSLLKRMKSEKLEGHLERANAFLKQLDEALEAEKAG